MCLRCFGVDVLFNPGEERARSPNFEIVPSEDGHWALTLDGFATLQDAMRFCNDIDEAIQIKRDWDKACKEAGE